MLGIALTIRRYGFGCLPSRRETRAWLGRLLFENDAADFFVLGGLQPLFIKGRRASEQLVQQHPQSVNVSPRVDIQPAFARLLRAHVGWRADHPAEARVNRLLR